MAAAWLAAQKAASEVRLVWNSINKRFRILSEHSHSHPASTVNRDERMPNGAAGTGRKVAGHRSIRCTRRLSRNLQAIVELEHAFEARELPSKLTSGCFEQVLGPQLYATYSKLANSSPVPYTICERCSARAARSIAERSVTNSSRARAVAHAPRRQFIDNQVRHGFPPHIILQTRRCQFRRHFERHTSIRSNASFALLAHRVHVRDARSL